MVCHCSVPNGFPQPDTRVLHPRHPAPSGQGDDAAFSPADSDSQKVLFHLPVTKAWLRQLRLGLTLICHSSLRGVVELLGDVFDCDLSVGAVHNVLQAAGRCWSGSMPIRPTAIC